METWQKREQLMTALCEASERFDAEMATKISFSGKDIARIVFYAFLENIVLVIIFGALTFWEEGFYIYPAWALFAAVILFSIPPSAKAQAASAVKKAIEPHLRQMLEEEQVEQRLTERWMSREQKANPLLEGFMQGWSYAILSHRGLLTDLSVKPVKKLSDLRTRNLEDYARLEMRDFAGRVYAHAQEYKITAKQLRDQVENNTKAGA